ncbi:hypothetical protein BS47DRAFT_1369933 [Hydnum rufescens UP504]|uniref:Uncharacterized protein n=1 Tax=Hydnum rufescens UP504 TaxID=1448309 RepID=A0A9P6ABV5_9AGAM|nr:hypothetical protein BS47DRAFT_1369933 [Hydnum rufescens UP504]
MEYYTWWGQTRYTRPFADAISKAMRDCKIISVLHFREYTIIRMIIRLTLKGWGGTESTDLSMSHWYHHWCPTGTDIQLKAERVQGNIKQMSSKRLPKTTFYEGATQFSASEIRGWTTSLRDYEEGPKGTSPKISRLCGFGLCSFNRDSRGISTVRSVFHNTQGLLRPARLTARAQRKYGPTPAQAYHSLLLFLQPPPQSDTGRKIDPEASSVQVMQRNDCLKAPLRPIETRVFVIPASSAYIWGVSAYPEAVADSTDPLHLRTFSEKFNNIRQPVAEVGDH